MSEIFVDLSGASTARAVEALRVCAHLGVWCRIHLTRFYVATIAAFVTAGPRNHDLDALAERLIASCGARDLPLRFYSSERL